MGRSSLGCAPNCWVNSSDWTGWTGVWRLRFQMPTTPGPNLLANVRWGVYWGFCGAIVYSAFAVLILIFRGEGPFATNDTTFGTVIALYFVSGITVGIVLGVLRPLTHSRVGAAIVGVICTIPAVFMGEMVLNERWSLEQNWMTVLVVSVVFGSLSGLIFWRQARRLIQDQKNFVDPPSTN